MFIVIVIFYFIIFCFGRVANAIARDAPISRLADRKLESVSNFIQGVVMFGKMVVEEESMFSLFLIKSSEHSEH